VTSQTHVQLQELSNMHANTKLRAIQKYETNCTSTARSWTNHNMSCWRTHPITANIWFTMQTQNPDIHMLAARKTMILRAPKPRLYSDPKS